MMQEHSVKTLGRGAFWSVLNQGIGQFLVLFVFLVTARYVSKEAFGIMATAMLAIELFRQILIESVGTSFYAMHAPTSADYNAGFAIIFAGGTVSAFLVFLFAQTVADVFDNAEIADTLRWISALLLTTGISKMHEVWLTKHMQFRLLAVRSIISIGIGGGVGVAMAIEGYGIASLIAQQIITALISGIWLWLACSWRPSLDFQWRHVAAIVNYGKFVSLNSAASFLGGQGDVLLSSYYLGPTATGVYSAAKRLLTAIALIVGSGLNSVALPALASFSADKERLPGSYLTGVGLTALLAAPLYAALAVLAPDIIYLLMGAKWADTAPVLAILSIVGFNRTVTQYSTNILLVRKKVHWQTFLAFGDAAANILLLVLVAKHGLLYLATAFVVKTLLFSPIATNLALHLLDLRYSAYVRKTFLPIALALMTAALVGLVRQEAQLPAVANLVLFIPLGGAVYFLLFSIFDRASLQQAIALLKETLRKTT
jgi:O-antigen/teichoic acid export membrane protein